MIKKVTGDERNQVRVRLLELFETLGNSDNRVLKARRDLMTALPPPLTTAGGSGAQAGVRARMIIAARPVACSLLKIVETLSRTVLETGTKRRRPERSTGRPRSG